MKNMMAGLTFIALLFNVIGCQSDKNLSNLNKIEIGMSRAEVLTIMGKPYKRECYQGKSGNIIDILLYETYSSWGYTTSGSAITPIVFNNGKLSGWGQNYYDNTLKIEITHKVQNTEDGQ